MHRIYSHFLCIVHYVFFIPFTITEKHCMLPSFKSQFHSEIFCPILFSTFTLLKDFYSLKYLKGIYTLKFSHMYVMYLDHIHPQFLPLLHIFFLFFFSLLSPVNITAHTGMWGHMLKHGQFIIGDNPKGMNFFPPIVIDC